jgi:sugar phosphate isomerase/epimerase
MSDNHFSRRDFLRLAGLGTAVLAIPSPLRVLADRKYEAKIGLQLYSIRKVIETDFYNSIKEVADMGYSGMETYALPESVALEHAAKVFKDVGLKISSMHSELPVGKDRDMALKMADAYKCDTIVYPGWPEGDKYKNKKNIDHMVEVHDEIASFLKSKGLRYGLHNHWWDFEKNDDGIVPFYYLLEHVDKEIFFEIDTYWAKTAGQDPAKIVKDFGKRAPLLHIKDGPAIEGPKSYEQVPAGQGVMDFPAIVKAGGDNIKWMIVEFDEYAKDIFDGVKDSYSYLTRNHLARGKKA